jgi:hypothetical protein
VETPLWTLRFLTHVFQHALQDHPPPTEGTKRFEYAPCDEKEKAAVLPRGSYDWTSAVTVQPVIGLLPSPTASKTQSLIWHVLSCALASRSIVNL